MTKDEFCLTLLLRMGHIPMRGDIDNIIQPAAVPAWRRARFAIACELGYEDLFTERDSTVDAYVLKAGDHRHHTVPSLRDFEVWLKEHSRDQG